MERVRRVSAANSKHPDVRRMVRVLPVKQPTKLESRAFGSLAEAVAMSTSTPRKLTSDRCFEMSALYQ